MEDKNTDGVNLETVFAKPYPILARELGDGSHETTIHIVDEIKEPHLFVEAVEVFRSAEEGDVIHLDLCTPGGRLDSTMMLLSAMNQTKAVTNARISGEVASAGTILALNCDSVEVSPYCNFMIHEPSYGTYGRSSEISSHVKFNDNNLREFFKEIYNPFLTAEECEEVLIGVPIYIGDVEIEQRFEVVLEKREADVIKRMEDIQYENDKQRLADAKAIIDELRGFEVLEA